MVSRDVRDSIFGISRLTSKCMTTCVRKLNSTQGPLARRMVREQKDFLSAGGAVPCGSARCVASGKVASVSASNSCGARLG